MINLRALGKKNYILIPDPGTLETMLLTVKAEPQRQHIFSFIRNVAAPQPKDFGTYTSFFGLYHNMP